MDRMTEEAGEKFQRKTEAAFAEVMEKFEAEVDSR
jgi:hypothetical protein